MRLNALSRLVGLVTERSRVVVAVMLILSLVAGVGIGTLEHESEFETPQSDGHLAEKNEFVDRHFSPTGANTTTVHLAVRNPDGNVLSRESLLRTLRLQQELRENETVNGTLVDDRPTVGIANVVAAAAIDAETGGAESAATEARPDRPNAVGSDSDDLERQIEQLESMSDADVERIVTAVLDDDTASSPGLSAFEFMPNSYDPGSTTADARLLVVTQHSDGDDVSTTVTNQDTIDAQVAVREIAHGVSGPEEYAVVGGGLVTHEEMQASVDGVTVLGPVMLLLVVGMLAYTYRDLLDIVLAVGGALLVLVWTFGIMGWAGLKTSPTLLMVPIFLLGLSVDYAIHVCMRYRESRTDELGPDTAMFAALSDVGPALILVTLTTAIGFLATTITDLPGVRRLGIASAIGIVSACLVFGILIPALKVELEAALESRGFDRHCRAFGTSGGRFTRVLSAGTMLARVAPVAVLVLALAVSGVALYGGSQIETDASNDVYMASDPPEWVSDVLPNALEPGPYHLAEDVDYLNANFRTDDRELAVLVEGDLTDPTALERLRDAGEIAEQSPLTARGPGGEPAVSGPIEAMTAVAQSNESFDETLTEADTNGDGVPDRNLETVYEEFQQVAPARANTVLHADGGEFNATVIRVTTVENATASEITDEFAAVEATIEGDDPAEDDDRTLAATVTGTGLVEEVVVTEVVETVVQGLVLTLLAIGILLVGTYRVTADSATLGAVTLLPVVCSVSWILGTMFVLGIPFNAVTTLVGGVAIGLGVDYAIHISERFAIERRRHDDVHDALEVTVTGTGGALLGSALTTGSGFAVLSFSLLTSVQQFGLVIALSICYSFVACVYVFPSALTVWATYGPAPDSGDADSTSRVSPESPVEGE